MKWSGSSGEFQQPPTGTHLARCIGVIDLGTQKNEYDPNNVKYHPQAIVRWELPTELMADGRPFMCSKRYWNTSLNPKSTLYGDLVNWRGKEFTAEELKGFDPKNLLDKTCMVSITANESGRNNITGIMRGPKNLECPPRVNDLVYLSLDKEDFDKSVFDSLSDYLKGIIMLSPEYAEVTNGSKMKHPVPPGDNVDPLDDDVPF